jgi:hypothetical protein
MALRAVFRLSPHGDQASTVTVATSDSQLRDRLTGGSLAGTTLQLLIEVDDNRLAACESIRWLKLVDATKSLIAITSAPYDRDLRIRQSLD